MLVVALGDSKYHRQIARPDSPLAKLGEAGSFLIFGVYPLNSSEIVNAERNFMWCITPPPVGLCYYLVFRPCAILGPLAQGFRALS